jgi:CubicO group peptidase (beta-lactamase class C family)
MYATARDWARFGLLYYNKGLYNGQRILTEDWVKQTAVPAPASDKKEYGYQFWLNAGEKERECPNSPADMYFADGYEGQRVFVIPSKKLVIVRLGLTQHKNFKQDDFVSSIVAAIN